MKAFFFITAAVVTLCCTLNGSAQTKGYAPPREGVPFNKANIVRQSQKTIVPAIEGVYKAAVAEWDESQPCRLTIEIIKKMDKYSYKLTLAGKVKRGAITISKSDDLKQFTCMLTLQGIKWASYDGDISREDDEHPAKKMKIPTDVTLGFINNELAFQNDGNAMNAYTVFAECDQKFVHLKKQ